MIVQKADMKGRLFVRTITFDPLSGTTFGEWREVSQSEYDQIDASQVYADGDGIGVWTISLSDGEKP